MTWKGFNACKYCSRLIELMRSLEELNRLCRRLRVEPFLLIIIDVNSSLIFSLDALTDDMGVEMLEGEYTTLRGLCVQRCVKVL